ncbi:MAG TPA: methyltransferase domain-containing protein [Phycisphaerae bacterium]
MDPKKPDRPSEEVMWAGPSGQRWLASATRFEDSLQPIGQALIDKAALSPGMRVIDVGCGAGSMSLDIAHRVAPTGTVTGLDISPDLIAEATRRADALHPKPSVQFILGDAARTSLPQADRLVSRFGSMFFTDPYAAFRHMHGFLQSSGRLALALWAPLKENPWMLEVRTILASHFDLPTPPPRTPGPFAYDEPDYLRDILTKANFQQIDISPFKTEMYVGGPGSSPESAADFLFQALSMAQRAIDAPPDVRAQVRTELIARLQSFMTPAGVRMPASTWLATASA